MTTTTRTTRRYSRGDTVRAAYWLADDGQSTILLTGPQHVDATDAALLAAAQAEAESVGLDITTGEIVVGTWTLGPKDW